MLLVADFSQYFFGMSIFITSMFLVMLVLVQRGRGGGLTGALGGAGGQSAFGTKAGDLFTRITIVVAAVWITLCAAAVFFLKDRELPGSGMDVRPSSSMSSTAAPVTPPATASPTDNNPPAAAIPDASTPTGTTSENSLAPENSVDAPPVELTPATDAPAEEKATVDAPAENP